MARWHGTDPRGEITECLNHGLLNHGFYTPGVLRKATRHKGLGDSAKVIFDICVIKDKIIIQVTSLLVPKSKMKSNVAYKTKRTIYQAVLEQLKKKKNQRK